MQILSQQPANSARLKLWFIIIISMCMSLSLLGFRIYFSEKTTYIFLCWNLFLAFLPFVLSSALSLMPARPSTALLFPSAALWLLFFPNSPYIITDLVHLRPRLPVPIWYDIVLVISFAWNGLVLGFLSLGDMHRLFEQRYGTIIGWFFAVSCLILGSFGVYLGRFLRWNSWDIVGNPMALLQDIFSRIANPTAHPRTYLITILLSAFLILGYLTIYQLQKIGNTYKKVINH